MPVYYENTNILSTLALSSKVPIRILCNFIGKFFVRPTLNATPKKNQIYPLFL
jgi:hypothetical protein